MAQTAPIRPLSRLMREEVIAHSMNSTLSCSRHTDAVGRERLIPLECAPRMGNKSVAWQPARSPSFRAALQGNRHRSPSVRSGSLARRYSDTSLDMSSRSRAYQHNRQREKLLSSRSQTPELCLDRRPASFTEGSAQNTRRLTTTVPRQRNARHSESSAHPLRRLTTTVPRQRNARLSLPGPTESALDLESQAVPRARHPTTSKSMRKAGHAVSFTARLNPIHPLSQQKKKISVKERKAAMIAAEQEARDVEMGLLWERVYGGTLRQVQYQSSLSTATKLPTIGQWHGLLLGGGISSLKTKLEKRPLSRSASFNAA